MGWPVTLPAEQRPEIAKRAIERYLDGERLEDIAQGHGVSKMRLNQILLEATEDEWKNAQVAAAITRLQDCEKELERAAERVESAEDMLSLTRVGEVARIAEKAAKLAQWKLERLCRRIYGQEAAQVLGSGLIQINIGIDRPVRDVQGALCQPQDIPS